MQDRWSLNIATHGKHYARIILPSNLTKAEAQKRAEEIAMAFRNDGSKDYWQFWLTEWTCLGKDISF